MSAPIILKMSKFRSSLQHLKCLNRQLTYCKTVYSFSYQRMIYTIQSATPSKYCVNKFCWNVKSLCSVAGHSRKCWNCGEELEEEKETFFCNCGVVQYIPKDKTYFELLQCEEVFDIDIDKISTLYKDLQKQYHPDKFSQKTKEEQAVAESQSSYINKAYTTLLKPLSRGLYLLELRGDPLEETNSSVNPEFLMEIMEVNEDLAEAEGNMEAVRRLEAINNKRIAQCVTEISQFFSEGQVPEAKSSLIKLKYFINVEDKIKEMHRQQM